MVKACSYQEHGEPAQILLNGKQPLQNLRLKVYQIQLIPGKDGADAVVTVREIIDEANCKRCDIRDTMYLIEPKVKVNGKVKFRYTIERPR